MAKMRVHELAKELNIKSQDILDKLKNTKFDGKSASSNMEDEAQALIRGAFAKETKSAEKNFWFSGIFFTAWCILVSR